MVVGWVSPGGFGGGAVVLVVVLVVMTQGSGHEGLQRVMTFGRLEG